MNPAFAGEVSEIDITRPIGPDDVAAIEAGWTRMPCSSFAAMHIVTITAKCQATLPAALCKELGLAPGTKVAVERRLVGKETVWVLKGPGPDWSWVGSLRRYGKGKSHRLSDIRRNIARGWSGGHRA